MIQKPSDRILQIRNALKILDKKEPEEGFSTYDSQAIINWLDEHFVYVETLEGDKVVSKLKLK